MALDPWGHKFHWLVAYSKNWRIRNNEGLPLYQYPVRRWGGAAPSDPVPVYEAAQGRDGGGLPQRRIRGSIPSCQVSSVRGLNGAAGEQAVMGRVLYH